MLSLSVYPSRRNYSPCRQPSSPAHVLVPYAQVSERRLTFPAEFTLPESCTPSARSLTLRLDTRLRLLEPSPSDAAPGTCPACALRQVRPSSSSLRGVASSPSMASSLHPCLQSVAPRTPPTAARPSPQPLLQPRCRPLVPAHTLALLHGCLHAEPCPSAPCPLELVGAKLLAVDPHPGLAIDIHLAVKTRRFTHWSSPATALELANRPIVALPPSLVCTPSRRVPI